MQPAATTRRVATEVASLAWPAVVQGLFHTVVFFTDRLILGRYGADAIASMQVSGPMLWSVFSVVGAFGAGVVAVIGRAVGAGDPDRARRTVAAVLAWGLLSGVVVAALGVPGSAWLADLMAGSDAGNDAVRALATAYMRVLFLAAPFDLLGVAAMTALQAGGDTKSPMRVSILAGALNLLLSWGLVFGRFGLPELGVVGSAVGSLASFATHGLVLTWVLRRRDGAVCLRRPEPPLFASVAAALRPVLQVSRAAFGEKLIFHTGFLVFAAITARLGEVAMAANQSLIAIESLGFIAAGGFGIASGALVAQKLGARRPADAARTGWVSAGLGFGSLSLVSLLFLLFPERLVSLFTPEPEVVALGARCLRIAAIAQPLMALTDSLAGALRGAGDTRSPMLVALVGPVVVRIAACWFLAVELDMGLIGIWLGTTIDWTVRSVALVVIWGRGRWRRISLS